MWSWCFRSGVVERLGMEVYSRPRCRMCFFLFFFFFPSFARRGVFFQKSRYFLSFLLFVWRHVFLSYCQCWYLRRRC